MHDYKYNDDNDNGKCNDKDEDDTLQKFIKLMTMIMIIVKNKDN